MSVTKCKKNKNGYILKIRFKGWETTFQSYEKNGEAADRIVKNANINLTLIKSKNLPWDSDWTNEEKTHIVRTGQLLPRENDPDEQVEEITFASGWDLYFDSINVKRLALVTRNGYRDKLNHIKKHLPTNFKLESLTRKKLDSLIQTLCNEVNTQGKHVGQKRDPNDVGVIMDTFGRMIRWLKRNQHIRLDTCIFEQLDYPDQEINAYHELEQWVTFSERKKELKKMGLPEDHEQSWTSVFYDEDEIERHLEILKQKLWETNSEFKKRLFCAINFALWIGARRVEVVRSRVSDVDLEGVIPTIKVWRKKGRGKKVWNKHNAEIHPRLLPYIRHAVKEAQEAGRQSLFMGTDSHIINEVKFSESSERTKAEDLSDYLGAALRGTPYENLKYWHIYKHTLASLYFAEGLAESQIEAIVGWKPDSGMARRYSHITKKHQTRLVNLIGKDDASEKLAKTGYKPDTARRIDKKKQRPRPSRKRSEPSITCSIGETGIEPARVTPLDPKSESIQD